MKTLKSWGLAAIILSLVSACGKTQPATPQAAPTESPQAPTEMPAEEPTAIPEPVEEPGTPLPPDPQKITFTASDGQELHGYYYPADHASAPLVVLMHWVNGDESDWNEVAIWLQNRGIDNPFENPAGMPWWDPSWFPAVDAGTSYGVFAFSLRGCEPFPNGCSGFKINEWYLDIQAAMTQASLLDGVDPNRIVAIGSSIGADGAAMGCAWLNNEKPGSCQGALSLSPGNYMAVPYAASIEQLCTMDHAKAVWCLADDGQEGAFCEKAGDYPEYKPLLIKNGDHGNMLLKPGLNPLPMQLILDFLKLTVGG